MPKTKSKKTTSPAVTLRVVLEADSPLSAALEAYLAGADFSAKQMTQYASLAEAAVKASDAKVLVAVTDPSEALARRMQAGQRPQEALDAWKAQAETLLREARRIRRQLVLVDARAVLNHDAAALAALGVSTPQEADAAQIAALPSFAMLVLAEAMLGRDPQAERFATEIAALRHGAGGVTFDMGAFDAAYAEQASLVTETGLSRENIARQKELHEEAVAESDLLRENVLRQKELYEEAMIASERLQAASADRHVVKAQAEALQRRLEDQSAQSTQREAVMAAVVLQDRAELRDAMMQIEVAQADADRLKAEVGQLKRELEGVYGSKSWRVTGPLRGIRARK